jgi:hypothetical protein
MRKYVLLALSHIYAASLGCYAYGEFLDNNPPGLHRWAISTSLLIIFIAAYAKESRKVRSGST